MPVTLAFDDLAGEVERRTGLPVNPPARFREGIDLLVNDVDRGKKLTREGRRLLQHELLRVVTQRCHFDQARSAAAASHPHDVLIITGLPRTKSTLLHNLIADIGLHCWLPHWQALEPFPLTSDPHAIQERIDRARAQLRFMRALSPDLLRVHPMKEDRPEECITLMQITGWSDRFAISLSAPAYREWMTQPWVVEYAYAEYMELLGLLFDSGRPLLLKAPSHATHVEQIRAHIPEARILWLSRSLPEVDASFQKLVLASRRLFESDPGSGDWAGWWSDIAVPPGVEVFQAAGVEALASQLAHEYGLAGPDAAGQGSWLRPSPTDRHS